MLPKEARSDAGAIVEQMVDASAEAEFFVIDVLVKHTDLQLSRIVVGVCWEGIKRNEI